MKKLLIGTAGVGFLLLGMLGLLLPFLPGFLFLLGAAACFASLSPQLRQRMHQHPRTSRFLARLEQSSHLGLLQRIKLAFWAGLETIIPRTR